MSLLTTVTAALAGTTLAAGSFSAAGLAEYLPESLQDTYDDVVDALPEEFEEYVPSDYEEFLALLDEYADQVPSEQDLTELSSVQDTSAEDESVEDEPAVDEVEESEEADEASSAEEAVEAEGSSPVGDVVGVEPTDDGFGEAVSDAAREGGADFGRQVAEQVVPEDAGPADGLPTHGPEDLPVDLPSTGDEVSTEDEATTQSVPDVIAEYEDELEEIVSEFDGDLEDIEDTLTEYEDDLEGLVDSFPGNGPGFLNR